nr:MAG TPA: hypothetical protein [Caudoviricetes sp.]
MLDFRKNVRYAFASSARASELAATQRRKSAVFIFWGVRLWRIWARQKKQRAQARP